MSSVTAHTSSPQESHDYPGHDLEALGELHNYQRWLLDAFGPALRGRVIEVGAGLGAVSAQYLKKSGVTHATLLEPAGAMHAQLRTRFEGDARVTTSHDTLDAWLAKGNGQGELYDAAIMVNVLEHVPDDDALLAQLHTILKPGGALLLFVPALPWLFGSLDRAVQHVRRYTRGSLTDCARGAGFNVTRCEYFDIAGVLPWWFVGRVLKPSHFNARAAYTYDRFVVPLMSRIEPHVSLPLGKSLSLVAIR